MPRISAENRSAAAFRAAPERRRAPAHLTRPAKVLWTQIVADRAPD